MIYMLDTKICIDIIRRRSPQLLNRLVACQFGDVGISSITLAELAHGAEKSSLREQNLIALQQFILPLEVACFDPSAALAYGKIRTVLESNGNLIGSMDMLIAAHAVALKNILVTNNEKKFRRVDGLTCENWIKTAG